jgi:dsDNA-specific endonuclease/ATPase MutS2
VEGAAAHCFVVEPEGIYAELQEQLMKRKRELENAGAQCAQCAQLFEAVIVSEMFWMCWFCRMNKRSQLTAIHGSHPTAVNVPVNAVYLLVSCCSHTSALQAVFCPQDARRLFRKP